MESENEKNIVYKLEDQYRHLDSAFLNFVT
jgi:hypothetical protein